MTGLAAALLRGGEHGGRGEHRGSTELRHDTTTTGSEGSRGQSYFPGNTLPGCLTGTLLR